MALATYGAKWLVVFIMCLCRLLKNYKHVAMALMIFLMLCRRAFVNWDGIKCKELAAAAR